jgi:hypothetical protein
MQNVVARLPTHSGMSQEEEMAVLCRPLLFLVCSKATNGMMV